MLPTSYNMFSLGPFHALCPPSSIKCYCGDDSTDYEQHGESNACSIPCLGDADEFCGGPDVMSVYGIHNASIIGEK